MFSLRLQSVVAIAICIENHTLQYKFSATRSIPIHQCKALQFKDSSCLPLSSVPKHRHSQREDYSGCAGSICGLIRHSTTRNMVCRLKMLMVEIGEVSGWCDILIASLHAIHSLRFPYCLLNLVWGVGGREAIRVHAVRQARLMVEWPGSIQVLGGCQAACGYVGADWVFKVLLLEVVV